MNVKREVSLKPIRTDSVAVFKDNKQLRKKHTHLSNFGEEYVSYKVVEDEIWLPRNAYSISTQDARDEGKDISIANNFIPRNEDQKTVVDTTVKLLQGGENFILQAATGFGKTWCACSVISRVGKRTLVVTTKEDILTQWVEALSQVCGLMHGEIGLWRGNKVPAPNTKVVVSLVQSLMKGTGRYNKKLFKGFGLVVVDECHRINADSFSKAMFYMPAKLRIGLSATPERRDGKDNLFRMHVGVIRVRAQTDVLPFDVVAYKTKWKIPLMFRNGKASPASHSPGRIMGLMNSFKKDTNRNLIAVSFVKKALDSRRSIVVFADTIAHLKVIESLFKKAGINDYGWYVGTSADVYKGSVDQRKSQRETAKTKSILLATYMMMSEGTDLPWLDTLVMLTPKSDVRQIIGRIRREYPDKKKPLVLDLVDSRSPVLRGYFNKRSNWYRQMKSKVKILG